MQRSSHDQSSFSYPLLTCLLVISLLSCLVGSGSAQEVQGTAARSSKEAAPGFPKSGLTGGSLPEMTAASGVTSSSPGRGTAGKNDENYHIGPGDLIDIRVFNQTELSRAVRVSAQGIIRLPYVGDLKAACLTESELALSIAEKYRKYINEPQVDVFVREYQSQPVAVIGAVDKPQQFQLQRRVKLLELLTFAGGPTKDAGHLVQVIHNGVRGVCQTDQNGDSNPAADGLSFTSYKLSDLLSGGPAANVYISPGDVVSVPEAEQIFVTGMVVKPGPVTMQAGTTLTQAIAMAGGLTPEAGRKVRLLRRKTDSSVVEEKVFNIDDIQKKKVSDVALEASDVVDVTNSAGRSIAQSLLKQIAPTLGLFPYIIRR